MSSRRCEQMTAFGADDVPDVKTSTHVVADVGLEAGVVGADARRARRRGRRRRRRTGGSVARDGLEQRQVRAAR